MIKVALIAIGTLMIAATALPLWKHDAWWVRIFDFPRLQITVLSGVVLVAYIAFGFDASIPEYAFLAALGACLAYQCTMMFPYTRLARKQVERSRGSEDESQISLIFANVLMENRNSAKLKEIIRMANPDVILAVETDDWWAEQLKEFESTHPYTVERPQDDTYGMLMHSRLELIDPEVKFIVEPNVPSFHARVKLPSGKKVVLRCLHPPPPIPTFAERSTERDAELLIVGREVKELDEPIIVLGDLNDVAWSYTNYLFQDLSGLLDPRIGRGFYPTFHAEYPFMRFPLDHFFHSNHFRLVEFRRLEYFGSDHFPVFIKLSYEPSAAQTQEELEANGEQQEEANGKIQKAMEGES